MIDPDPPLNPLQRVALWIGGTSWWIRGLITVAAVAPLAGALPMHRGGGFGLIAVLAAVALLRGGGTTPNHPPAIRRAVTSVVVTGRYSGNEEIDGYADEVIALRSRGSRWNTLFVVCFSVALLAIVGGAVWISSPWWLLCLPASVLMIMTALAYQPARWAAREGDVGDAP